MVQPMQMETIPSYIPLLFSLTVALTLFFLLKASGFSRTLFYGSIAWLLIQAFAGFRGFYTVTAGVPPRFTLLLLPPVVFVVTFFISRRGRELSLTMDAGTLTLLHIVRIPVEIVLYLLMLHKVVPEVMTFAGRNYDILCGITAPIIYYFGFVKKNTNPGFLIVWNLLCLLLLGNIVFTALLSAPFRFQRFGFEQPSIALFYFPYIWLPCFVVPAALFAHFSSLNRLLNKRRTEKRSADKSANKENAGA